MEIVMVMATTTMAVIVLLQLSIALATAIVHQVDGGTDKTQIQATTTPVKLQGQPTFWTFTYKTEDISENLPNKTTTGYGGSGTLTGNGNQNGRVIGQFYNIKSEPAIQSLSTEMLRIMDMLTSSQQGKNQHSYEHIGMQEFGNIGQQQYKFFDLATKLDNSSNNSGNASGWSNSYGGNNNNNNGNSSGWGNNNNNNNYGGSSSGWGNNNNNRPWGSTSGSGFNNNNNNTSGGGNSFGQNNNNSGGGFGGWNNNSNQNRSNTTWGGNTNNGNNSSGWNTNTNINNGGSTWGNTNNTNNGFNRTNTTWGQNSNNTNSGFNNQGNNNNGGGSQWGQNNNNNGNNSGSSWGTSWNNNNNNGGNNSNNGQMRFGFNTNNNSGSAWGNSNNGNNNNGGTSNGFQTNFGNSNGFMRNNTTTNNFGFNPNGGSNNTGSGFGSNNNSGSGFGQIRFNQSNNNNGQSNVFGATPMNNNGFTSSSGSTWNNSYSSSGFQINNNNNNGSINNMPLAQLTLGASGIKTGINTNGTSVQLNQQQNNSNGQGFGVFGQKPLYNNNSNTSSNQFGGFNPQNNNNNNNQQQQNQQQQHQNHMFSLNNQQNPNILGSNSNDPYNYSQVISKDQVEDILNKTKQDAIKSQAFDTLKSLSIGAVSSGNQIDYLDSLNENNDGFINIEHDERDKMNQKLMKKYTILEGIVESEEKENSNHLASSNMQFGKKQTFKASLGPQLVPNVSATSMKFKQNTITSNNVEHLTLSPQNLEALNRKNKLESLDQTFTNNKPTTQFGQKLNGGLFNNQNSNSLLKIGNNNAPNHFHNRNNFNKNAFDVQNNYNIEEAQIQEEEDWKNPNSEVFINKLEEKDGFNESPILNGNYKRNDSLTPQNKDLLEIVINYPQIFDNKPGQYKIEIHKSRDVKDIYAKVEEIIEQICGLRSGEIDFFILYKNALIKPDQSLEEVGITKNCQVYMQLDSQHNYLYEEQDQGQGLMNMRSLRASLDPRVSIGVVLADKAMLPKPPKAGYQISPDMSDLSRMTLMQLQRVPDFTISNQHGSITFEGETDLTQVDLEDVVTISKRAVEVYGDDQAHLSDKASENVQSDGTNRLSMRRSGKPPLGEKLNKKAVITLYDINVKKGDSLEEKAKILEERALQMQGEHLSYDVENKIWKFRVFHF
eukprot:403369179